MYTGLLEPGGGSEGHSKEVMDLVALPGFLAMRLYYISHDALGRNALN